MVEHLFYLPEVVLDSTCSFTLLKLISYFQILHFIEHTYAQQLQTLLQYSRG